PSKANGVNMNEDFEAKVQIGKMNQRSAEIFCHKLQEQGVEVVSLFNKMTCTTGCSTEVELWAHPQDLEFISDFLKRDWQAQVDSLGVENLATSDIAGAAYGDSKCPACGYELVEDSPECIECGLSLSVDVSSAKSCKSGNCK
ncbi:MAG: hypothetical protein NT027_05260, partial [Proteobacteria bacterium]|nr:hypothetical protein [Pseudomonadota bacterium]